MIWANPWAWAGLAGIALPLLIHLLGRGQARVQRFPSLRFLDASRLLPTRRTRLHDLLLLATRVAILAAAVAAMAQPLVVTAHRSHTLGAPLARAIIVDTSASMRRATPAGEPATTAARRIAVRLRDSASTSVVVETADPATAIAGASAWLLNQPWRGEINVISDFQTGAIDSIDLSAVPRRLGIRLSRIDVHRDTTADLVVRVAGADVVADATPRGADTEVRWSRRGQTAAVASTVVTPLATDDARIRVAAAEHAAAMIGVGLPLDTSRSIAVLYPGAPTSGSVLHGATAPHVPWMTNLVARLRADSMLVDAAIHAQADTVGSKLGTATNAGLVVVRNSNGQPIVSAVQSADARDGLVLVSHADAGSLASAALIAAASRAQSLAPSATELEPSVVSDSVLALWQRAPAAADVARANGGEGPSDARWLWILALALIGVESWLRRRGAGRKHATGTVTPSTPERARVA